MDAWNERRRSREAVLPLPTELDHVIELEPVDDDELEYGLELEDGLEHVLVIG